MDRATPCETGVLSGEDEFVFDCALRGNAASG